VPDAVVAATVGATAEPAALVPAGATEEADAEPAVAVGCPAFTGSAVGGSVAVGSGAELVAVGAGALLPPQASRIIVIVDAESPIAAARRRNARRVIRPYNSCAESSCASANVRSSIGTPPP
jgi:hypothetical protein